MSAVNLPGAGGGAAGAAGAGTAGIKLTKNSFGLQMPYVAGGGAHPEIGYGIYRMWGGLMTWRQIESNTTKGLYTWTRFDAEMLYAKNNGLRAIYTIGQAPDYATGGAAGGPLAAGGQYNNKPCSVQDFTDHMTQIGNRAKAIYGTGMIWEIWNEVSNIPGGNFYDGPPSTLVSYALAAKTVLKAIDPTCIILTPSITASVTYINQMMDLMFAAGIGAHVDGMAVHGYVTPSQPETIISYLRNYRASAAKYGFGGLPCYDTESTMASFIEIPGGAQKTLTTGNVMSDQQRVAYVLRRWLSGLAGGYSVQSHYGPEFSVATAGGDDFKVLNLWDATNVLNAGGIAMKNFLTLMIGATVQAFQSRPRGVYALSVLLADGTPGVWLWTGDGVSCPFPQAASYDLAVKVDYLNVRTAISGSESIGNIPKLFLSANTSMKSVDISSIMAAIEQVPTVLVTTAVWTGAAIAAGGTASSGTLSSYNGTNPQLLTAAACWSFVPIAGTPQINIPVTNTLLVPGKRHRLWAEVEMLTAAPWKMRLLDGAFVLVPGQELNGNFTLTVTGPGIQRISTDFDYPLGSPLPAATLRLQLFLDSASDITRLSGCRVGVQIMDTPV